MLLHTAQISSLRAWVKWCTTSPCEEASIGFVTIFHTLWFIHNHKHRSTKRNGSFNGNKIQGFSMKTINEATKTIRTLEGNRSVAFDVHSLSKRISARILSTDKTGKLIWFSNT